MDFLFKVFSVNPIVKQESRWQANPSSAYFCPVLLVFTARLQISSVGQFLFICCVPWNCHSYWWYDANCFLSVQNKLHVEFIIFLRSLVWRQISLDHCAKESVILLVGFCQLLQLIKLAKCFFVMDGAPFVTYVHVRAFPCLMVFENFHDIDFGGETLCCIAVS